MRLPQSNRVGSLQGVMRAEGEHIAAEVGLSIPMASTGHGMVLVHCNSHGRYGMLVGKIDRIWVWDCSGDPHVSLFLRCWVVLVAGINSHLPRGVTFPPSDRNCLSDDELVISVVGVVWRDFEVQLGNFGSIGKSDTLRGKLTGAGPFRIRPATNGSQ